MQDRHFNPHVVENHPDIYNTVYFPRLTPIIGPSCTILRLKDSILLILIHEVSFFYRDFIFNFSIINYFIHLACVIAPLSV